MNEEVGSLEKVVEKYEKDLVQANKEIEKKNRDLDLMTKSRD